MASLYPRTEAHNRTRRDPLRLVGQLQGWTVLWFEDGLITARSIFRDRAEVLEAAGLSE
jgi:hypothetical protein